MELSLREARWHLSKEYLGQLQLFWKTMERTASTCDCPKGFQPRGTQKEKLLTVVGHPSGEGGGGGIPR